MNFKPAIEKKYFKSTREMYDGGYALMEYSILSDSIHWRFRDEKFKVSIVIPCVRNDEPSILLAKIEDVRAAAL